MNLVPMLTRDPLQILRVDAIGYGAKDTGEMGGGAAAAVLTAAGPEILTALRYLTQRVECYPHPPIGGVNRPDVIYAK
ncbi:MAG TPA: hypothetical protein VEC99_12600 [Clostridia bacterium]|nr:hypothetical protein [Clostridia bacterium]